MIPLNFVQMASTFAWLKFFAGFLFLRLKYFVVDFNEFSGRIIVSAKVYCMLTKAVTNNKPSIFTYVWLLNTSNFMQCFSCVSPDYMAQQFDINERMRAILIDWLIEVYTIFSY